MFGHLLTSQSDSGSIWDDDFRGDDDDPPDSDKWLELVLPASGNGALLLNNKFHWTGAKPPEEISRWRSTFKMSKAKTWEVQITMDWLNLGAIDNTANGPQIRFGYGNSAGTFWHSLQVSRTGGWSGLYQRALNYTHTPGNHGTDNSFTKPLKVKFRWYGPDEGALAYRSTVWVWNDVREQWEFDRDVSGGGVTTAGMTIVSGSNADHHIILEFSTDCSTQVTSALLEDATFDNFIVNEGDVLPP